MNDLTPGSDFKRMLMVDGRERWYAGHVPATWEGISALPVVIAIHGATSNPRLMERFSGLSEKADAAGFLVIYPAGSGVLPTVLTWNGGDCCGYAAQQQIDDVAWLDRMLENLASVLPIDESRLYLAGMSNGAHMAYRYAAARSERVAAIAAVGGPMASPLGTLAKPVPLLVIHGTEDEFAPYHGGVGPKSAYKTPLRSAPDTVADWVRANGLPSTPTIRKIPDLVGDGTTIDEATYGPGPDGTVVIFQTVHGAGHTWPGRPPLPLTLGKSSNNMNANDVIWDFFQTHGRKS